MMYLALLVTFLLIVFIARDLAAHKNHPRK